MAAAPVMYRAARIAEVGKNLELLDVEAPRPGLGQVLVRNHAVAIQPLDAKILLTGYGPRLDYPAVLGTTGAGVIEQLGDGVQDLNVGDRIVFDTRAYVNTDENIREGTWQQMVVVDIKTVAKVSQRPRGKNSDLTARNFSDRMSDRGYIIRASGLDPLSLADGGRCSSPLHEDGQAREWCS